MKVTEFSENTKIDHVSPPWEKFLGKDDFISYMPSYIGGTMIDEFDEYSYPTNDTGNITYYLFNPTKHCNNIDSSEKLPLIVFIHGATNSFDGRKCISHSGGEMFATEKYQSEIGKGAFILVPLANEKKDENGMLCDSWNDKYLPHLKAIIEETMQKYAVSKVIITGGSSGGAMTWKAVLAYPELFNGCIPVSSGFMPDVSQLKMLEKYGIKIIYACGKHDEFNCYDEKYLDSYRYIAEMQNGICYIPEWTRNGDYGVASLFFGIEMGQHCMITQIQANLMFNDGKPYCEHLPHGITGWIKDI
ncbi:MAG: hypothetical protein K2J47_03655 [Ruminococcus sp.]|nr:hypothetical protein [Ruminococcus sp.]